MKSPVWIEYGFSIDFKKDECRGKRCPFIAVKEGMILREMISVSRGHFKKVAVKPLSCETCLRLGKCGLQKMKVTDSGAAAIKFNLIFVDFDDFCKCKEKRLAQDLLFRKFSQRFSMPLIDLGKSHLDPLMPFRIRDR